MEEPLGQRGPLISVLIHEREINFFFGHRILESLFYVNLWYALTNITLSLSLVDSCRPLKYNKVPRCPAVKKLAQILFSEGFALFVLEHVLIPTY